MIANLKTELKVLNEQREKLEERVDWEQQRRLTLESDVEKYRNMALMARGAKPRPGWEIALG